VLARRRVIGQDACDVVHDSSEEQRSESPDRSWVILTRATLAVVGVLLAVLIVTGVMLMFQYRPDTTPEFARVYGIQPHLFVRTVHRTASRLLLPAFTALFVAAVGLAVVRHRPVRVVWPILAGVAVLAASFTGYLLPWDQLAFWSVRVGEHVSGYRPILFHSNVKYVLLGNKEIGTSTLARWVWVHSIGVTVVLIALLIVIGVQTRATRQRTASDADALR
jgi:quinol-cytochrome oxidoreductase complex cytochrome b subunit